MDEIKKAIKGQKTKESKLSDEEIKKQLYNTQKELEDNTTQLKRLQAEFENHIKRTDKEKKDLCEFAAANLMKKILPLLDDFENAIEQLNKIETNEEVKDGINMIFNNMMKIMKEEGLSEINCKGLADPFKHEVMLQKESEQPEGIIIQELQKGYAINGKVLRPSKVIVSKPINKKNHNTEE